MKKYTFILLSITFCFFLFYGIHRLRISRNYKIIDQFCNNLSFAQEEDPSFIIHPFPTDSGFVVVLPSFWDSTKVLAKFEGLFATNITINNLTINNTWVPVKIKTDTTSLCFINGFLIDSNKDLHIHFFRSSLNSIFINTESGTLGNINNSIDKSYKESGIIKAVDATGKVDYCGELSSIHGRGNMTWAMHKKPYNIKIKEKTKIFNLKKSNKFNLLANACDETSLRNWIMLTTAERLNMQYAICSDFTVLYLNGHYNGLYQITNKIDISHSGVDIKDLEKEYSKLNYLNSSSNLSYFSIDRNDTVGIIKGITNVTNPNNISGGYLIDTNFKPHRYKEAIAGFIPQYGYPIEIKSPQKASKEQVEYLSNYYNEMMDAIRSENGINSVSKMHFSDYIDIDSFIYYYICSECFYNLDAVFSSFFMYKDCDDKLYCGPIWDYDLCLNTKAYPDKTKGYNSFYVREIREKDGSPMIFGQLYKHKDYKNRLIYLFNNKVLPILEDYSENGLLDSINNCISKDLILNNYRWPNEYNWMYDLLHDHQIWNETTNVEYKEIEEKGDYWNLKNFLHKRTAFLKEVWSSTEKEQEFKTIYWNFGRTEQFQHYPTIIAYLYKANQFSVPRFLVKDQDIQLVGIYDKSGQKLNTDSLKDYYELKYEFLH